MSKLDIRLINNEGRNAFNTMPTYWDFNKSQWILAQKIELTSKGDNGWNYAANQYGFVAGGGSWTMLLDYNNFAWGTGDNYNGYLGDNGTYGESKSSPVSVVGGNRFKYISAGELATAAIDLQGYAWGWGYNVTGVIGDSTQTDRFSPVSVFGGRQFTQIGSGQHFTIALATNGFLWSWGWNLYGQLGDSSLVSKSSPVSIFGGRTFTQLAVGLAHSAALDNNGYAYCWGYSAEGQLGGGTNTAQRSSPTSVVGGKVFTKISAGRNNTAAIDTSGYAWTWGYNTYGQLGTSNRINRSSPVSVFGGRVFTQIMTGFYHCAALDTSGYVYAWGDNTYGQLGASLATTESRSSPVSVYGAHVFKQLALGSYYHTVAIDFAGDVWAWGRNDIGQLGDGTTNNASYPIKILKRYEPFSYSQPVARCKWEIDQLSVVNAGGNTSGILTSDGFLWKWGSNDYGELGTNEATTVSRSSPGSVVGNRRFSMLGYGNGAWNNPVALDSMGYAWCWGYNEDGRCGDSTTINRSSPVSVYGGKQFITCASCAAVGVGLDSGGFAWSWGYNGGGGLGDGTVNNRSFPVSVVGNHSFIKIVGRYIGCMGLKSDGSLWSWGEDNGYSTVGDSASVNRSSPVAVYGGRKFVTMAGCRGCAAIDDQGFLWTWGRNDVGTCGDNTVIQRSYPVSVVGGRRFISVSVGEVFMIALDTDGYAWCWGGNGNGECGDGTTTNRSSPVSVVGGHRFLQAVAGNDHCIAMDFDGYIWSWGYNVMGQLGTNNTVLRSSPVLICRTF